MKKTQHPPNMGSARDLSSVFLSGNSIDLEIAIEKNSTQLKFCRA